MPKSYPASCDFMVARPPTYQESMNNFYNNKNNNSKDRTYNYSNNIEVNECYKEIKPTKNKKINIKKSTCNIQ